MAEGISDGSGMDPHLHGVELPIAMEVTAEGTSVEITDAVVPHGFESFDESIEASAAALGLSVDEVAVVAEDGSVYRPGSSDKSSRSSRTYGFSNWGGCKWEPAGPKFKSTPTSNPHLN